MKVLVIPDIHLKPYMFRHAAALMRTNITDKAVCLMDIADDWGKAYEVSLYEETFDEAIHFANMFPDTLWCWGNHDLSYRWHCLESGYSSMASFTVQKKLIQLQQSLPENNSIQFIQKIDNVLFSHGGISKVFVEEYISKKIYNDVEAVVEEINKFGKNEMWNDMSPLWLRPQNKNMELYKPRKCLQVVGHTPMKQIVRKRNLISCDVFSTYKNGEAIGTEEFLLLDTVTWEYTGIKL